MTQQAVKKPTLVDAAIPVACLIVMLSTSVYLFGSDSSYGANQIALILAACIASVVGLKNGHSWKSIQDGIVDSIMMAMVAVLILLAVGMLIGTWILAGTVPAMINYGLALLSPAVFYPATCLICAIVALSIGSSWTVAGTIGIGLIGVAQGMGLSVEITAGAIISGAYLGDKLSPLSDTTNLAPSVAGSELFPHIQNLMWTTVPSFVISLILFSILALGADSNVTETELATLRGTLQDQFHIAWYMLLPVAVLLALAFKKVPAIPTIVIGGLTGVLFALLFQGEAVARLAEQSRSGVLAQVQGVWMASFNGYVSNTGNEMIDSLLTRGGMSSMLNTIWLVMSAMTFGGVMEKTGLLTRLVAMMVASAHSAGGLIRSLIVTCIGTNVVTGDQYISIVLPGRMFQKEFQQRGLHPLNLSRNLEDSGTVTSVLIPWNTCGAFMAATLGVATGAYFWFAFFNLINPLIALLYSYINFKIIPLEDFDENSAELKKP